MDKRHKPDRIRANGKAAFSPLSRRPLTRSLFKNGESAHGVRFAQNAQTAKAHAVCAFAVSLAALPLAALASDAAETKNIVLDVAQNGTLGALVGAAAMWLINRSRAQTTQTTTTVTERNPPLGEEVAKTFVTKTEFEKCQGFCRRDIDSVRELIDEKDRNNEERSIGTHKRIDQVYKSLNKNNRSLGIIIGALFAQGKIPASALAEAPEGD